MDDLPQPPSPQIVMEMGTGGWPLATGGGWLCMFMGLGRVFRFLFDGFVSVFRDDGVDRLAPRSRSRSMFG